MEEFEVDEEEYTGAAVFVEADDNVPSMPEEFYQNVEHFLARGPPKIKGEKKKKKGIDEEPKPSRQGTTLPMLPNPTKSKADLPPRPIQPVVASKVYAKSEKSKLKEIDPNLLMQAFAYTEQLAREAIVDEDEDGTGGKTGSAPQRSRPSNQRDLPLHPHTAPVDLGREESAPRRQAPKGSGKSGGAGVVKRLRSKTQAHTDSGPPPAGFTVSAIAEEDLKKNTVDFDALVANFEQGITLQKLQDELKSSKLSMQRSEDFMKQLARDLRSSKLK